MSKFDPTTPVTPPPEEPKIDGSKTFGCLLVAVLTIAIWGGLFFLASMVKP